MPYNKIFRTQKSLSLGQLDNWTDLGLWQPTIAICITFLRWPLILRVSGVAGV